MDKLPVRLENLMDTILQDRTISSWRIQENTGLFLSIKFSGHCDNIEISRDTYYRSKPQSAIQRDTERDSRYRLTMEEEGLILDTKVWIMQLIAIPVPPIHGRIN